MLLVSTRPISLNTAVPIHPALTCNEVTPKCAFTSRIVYQDLICFTVQRLVERHILQILKDQATGPSETLVPIGQTTRNHIPQDHSNTFSSITGWVPSGQRLQARQNHGRIDLSLINCRDLSVCAEQF
jgi:hypothetical protein